MGERDSLQKLPIISCRKSRDKSREIMDFSKVLLLPRETMILKSSKIAFLMMPRIDKNIGIFYCATGASWLQKKIAVEPFCC